MTPFPHESVYRWGYKLKEADDYVRLHYSQVSKIDSRGGKRQDLTPFIIPTQKKIHLDIRSIFGIVCGPGVVKMKITKDIKPVTYLKSRAADLLNQINETHRPVIITQNGEPRAVLQDPESYENMRNAIGLLKLISQGESDVRNGRVKSQEEVFKDIENSLKEKL